jgi:hypothetical protein
MSGDPEADLALVGQPIGCWRSRETPERRPWTIRGPAASEFGRLRQ